MSKTKNRNQAGSTLIEVLVSGVLLIIMLTVAQQGHRLNSRLITQGDEIRQKSEQMLEMIEFEEGVSGFMKTKVELTFRQPGSVKEVTLPAIQYEAKAGNLSLYVLKKVD